MNAKIRRRYTVCTALVIGALLIGCSHQQDGATEITITPGVEPVQPVATEPLVEATGDTNPTESVQATDTVPATEPAAEPTQSPSTEPTMSSTQMLPEPPATELVTPEPPATDPTQPVTEPPQTEPTQPAAEPTAPLATQPSETKPLETKPLETDPLETEPSEPANGNPTEPKETEVTVIAPPELETVHTHSYTEEVVDPTCYSQGYIQYVCFCGDIYQDFYTDKVKHQFVTVETIWQTIEADGYQRIACIYGCGIEATIVLPKLTEIIDMSELVRYGNEYAAQYGYVGNINCCPENGAGYYPAIRKKITTMEEGYAAARSAIESQYHFDISYGVNTQGLPVNIQFESTEDPTVFYIYVYYGGDCG